MEMEALLGMSRGKIADSSRVVRGGQTLATTMAEEESLLRVIRRASSGLGLDRVSPVTDTSLEQTWRDHRREWIAATAAQK